MEIGPWGLVTLALGATPTLTAELELELELEPVLEDELLLELLDLAADFPPPLGLELDAALRPG